MAKETKKSKYGSLRGMVNAGAQQLAGKGSSTLNIGDMKFWRPEKAGKYEIDIIPYEVSIKNHPEVKAGNLFQQLAYKVHRNVGPDERTIVCPTSVGRKCPLCERLKEVYKDPNATKEDINELKPKSKVAFNIIDLEDKNGEVKVFDNSPFNFANELYKEIKEGDGAFDAIFDLTEGLTIKVRFDEESMGKNKFLQAGRIDFLERDPYPDSIVEECCDLDKALVVMSYEEIEALFLGVDDVDQEEEKPKSENRREEPEQEEEKPRSRRQKEPEPEQEEEKPQSRRKRQEPEPEQEEEKDSVNKCPHDFTFGADCEANEECDSCNAWSDCRDEKEKLDAAKSSSRKRR